MEKSAKCTLYTPWFTENLSSYMNVYLHSLTDSTHCVTLYLDFVVESLYQLETFHCYKVIFFAPRFLCYLFLFLSRSRAKKLPKLNRTWILFLCVCESWCWRIGNRAWCCAGSLWPLSPATSSSLASRAPSRPSSEMSYKSRLKNSLF